MATTQIDEKRNVPVWFWLTLFLILIAAIIVYFATQNDGRTDQRNVEKNTTHIDTKTPAADSGTSPLRS